MYMAGILNEFASLMLGMNYGETVFEKNLILRNMYASIGLAVGGFACRCGFARGTPAAEQDFCNDMQRPHPTFGSCR